MINYVPLEVRISEIALILHYSLKQMISGI